MKIHAVFSNYQAITSLFFARELGFEPRSKVLETRMLPLHHSRIKYCRSKPRKGLKVTVNLKNFLKNKVPKA